MWRVRSYPFLSTRPMISFSLLSIQPLPFLRRDRPLLAWLCFFCRSLAMAVLLPRVLKLISRAVEVHGRRTFWFLLRKDRLKVLLLQKIPRELRDRWYASIFSCRYLCFTGGVVETQVWRSVNYCFTLTRSYHNGKYCFARWRFTNWPSYG